MTSTEFREARSTLGLTQPQMAEKIGVGLRAVKYYEGGGRKVPGPVALLVAALVKGVDDA